MRTLSAVTLLVLGSAFAADPAPETVVKLIEQLGSPDYKTRETASKELDALGGPVLPALTKAAASSGDAEAARRAADLAARIARQVDNDKAIAPTLVELNFEDAALATVLAELQKQAGGRLAYDNLDAPGAKVTVKTGGKVPFWEAVARVTAAAGLEVAPAAAPAVSTSAARGREARLLAERQVGIANALAAQQQQLKAARAEAAKIAAVDKQKAEELLQRQKREMDQVLARLVQMQAMLARQAVLDQTTRSPSSPVNSSVIALRPKSGRPNPSCVSGAVRVEAIPFPAAALATVPRDTIPVVVHASPEPRLKWERIEAVRVTKAADDAGRELAVAADDETRSARVFPVQGGAIVVGGNGVTLVPADDLRLSRGFTPTAMQALVRLKTDGGSPKSLTALEGVIRGVIRTGPEEQAAVAGLDKKPIASALGVNGVALAVTVTERPEGGAFDVEATLRYNLAEVQVAGQPDVDETVQGRGGRAVLIRVQAPAIVPGGQINRERNPDRGSASAFGLTVTDAEGKPFTLTAISSRRTFDRTGGEVTDRVRLLARPAEQGRGSPAKVSFAGTRAKVVEVPFKLADVPAMAGTAEVPDEPKKPAGR